jgi:Spirocyclase AveC-like
VTSPVSSPARVVTSRKFHPVQWWAGFGAAVFAFVAYLMIRWVTGPNFERVPVGPSEPPEFMKVVLNTGQVLLSVTAVVTVYWFLIRPWRQGRGLTTDGLLVLCFGSVWWIDPVGNYFGHWIVYNAYLPNRGSWVAEVPGWNAYAAPGATTVEPFPFLPGMYITLFFLMTVLVSKLMGWMRGRWPHWSSTRIMATAFVAGLVLDIPIEAFGFMPLGFWEFPGAGHQLVIFPDSYHAFPLHLAALASALWTGFGALRFFRNDRGETVAERGLSEIKLGTGRKNVVRYFAMFGAANAVMLGYVLPATIFIGSHTSSWPADLQQRSYFLDGVCGDGTDRLCPQAGLPNPRGNDSIDRTSTDGTLRLPNGELARQVPVVHGPTGGPFSGPIFRP